MVEEYFLLPLGIISTNCWETINTSEVFYSSVFSSYIVHCVILESNNDSM